MTHEHQPEHKAQHTPRYPSAQQPPSPPRTAATRRLAAGLTAGLAVAALGAAGAATPAGAVAVTRGESVERASAVQVSTEEAERQSSLVAEEDRRLIEIRTVTALARWQNKNWKTPYRLNTGSGYTLVLTPRSSPYTVEDLLRLAPQTFVRQPDGSYLLSENIVVTAGAALNLSAPGKFVLRMASGTNGFVTIVSFGGRLSLAGTAQAPLQLTSWDPRTNEADAKTDDGRAYVRAIGGQFTMEYVEATRLGFWSGRTGGIALTGTDRPNTGAIERTKKTGEASSAQVKGSSAAGSLPGRQGTGTGTGSQPTPTAAATTGTGDASTQRKDARRDERRADHAAESAADVNDRLGGQLLSPAGSLPGVDTKFSVPSQSYVSGRISHTEIDGNAFGIFVSGASGIQIADTTVTGSLFDGVVLHRFVTTGVVERTVSRASGGDGFVLARATEGIVISEATAEENAGNGFSLSGRPLADGPSATGAAVNSYGNNSVSNSVARNNGRNGVEVLGGFNIGVQNNDIEGNDMGIVVRDAATKVSVVGNELSGQARHGIALREGVTAGAVTGNIVDGGTSGVYLRDSVAQVRGNTVNGVSRHGVSLVGVVGGSEVAHNVISGTGPSAIDTARGSGDVDVDSNQVTGWRDTSSWVVKLKRYAHPMTLLWTTVILLILVTAVRGRRRRHARGVHPYEHQMPLTFIGPLESGGDVDRAPVHA